jgi:Rrf2 family nitric oxide-sensitive transcriptional repressor
MPLYVARSLADADRPVSIPRPVPGETAMRLTTYTDYTLRVLIRLAVRPHQLTTIADIAESYGISENHLTKVVHQLGIAGYIETVRGRNGGIRLLKEPREINVGEIVRRTEPDFDLVPCFNTSDACVIEPACILKGVLDQARGAFLAVLDRCTLADLVRPQRKLATLLNLQPGPV